MAYICGIVSKEERETLERRGWDVESCPAELIPVDEEESRDDYVMIWVDSSVFDVMSGPGWDTKEA